MAAIHRNEGRLFFPTGCWEKGSVRGLAHSSRRLSPLERCDRLFEVLLFDVGMGWFTQGTLNSFPLVTNTTNPFGMPVTSR